jgi:D-methionine transport system ATP-binding protein
MNSTIVSFQGVSKVFPTKKTHPDIFAVKDVSLDIYEGEIFGFIGFSGAGKTTIIRLINGLEKPTKGKVLVNQKDITSLNHKELRVARKEIGMIFQQFNLFNFMTVRQNIEFPLKIAKVPENARNKRIDELMEFVGITQHANQYPATLSGGQKQRVGIARALTNNPKILLADEPTSALDPQITIDVLRLLRNVNRQFGITVIMISHSMNVVRLLCDRVAVMDFGGIVEMGNSQDLLMHPKSKTTKSFVNALLMESLDATDDDADVSGDVGVDVEGKK